MAGFSAAKISELVAHCRAELTRGHWFNVNFHTDAVVSFESFRALKVTLFESFKVLKYYDPI